MLNTLRRLSCGMYVRYIMYVYTYRFFIDRTYLNVEEYLKKKLLKTFVSCVGVWLSTLTGTWQEQREAATEVGDRCDVKKAAKERPIKRNGFTQKKREKEVVKKWEVQRLGCGELKAIPGVKMSWCPFRGWLFFSTKRPAFISLCTLDREIKNQLLKAELKASLIKKKAI